MMSRLCVLIHCQTSCSMMLHSAFKFAVTGLRMLRDGSRPLVSTTTVAVQLEAVDTADVPPPGCLCFVLHVVHLALQLCRNRLRSRSRRAPSALNKCHRLCLGTCLWIKQLYLGRGFLTKFDVGRNILAVLQSEINSGPGFCCSCGKL